MSENKTDVDKLLENYSNISTEKPDSILIFKDGKQIELSEDILRKYVGELVDWMNNEARRRKDFGMSSKMLSHLMELKRSFMPALQKSATVTMDFNQYMKQWMDARKELTGMVKNGEIIITAAEDKILEDDIPAC